VHDVYRCIYRQTPGIDVVLDLSYRREINWMGECEQMPILVRGAGDVGSAVAVVLFGAGYIVALHDDPAPATHRRGMAFTDAVFDRWAILEGLNARRVETAPASHRITDQGRPPRRAGGGDGRAPGLRHAGCPSRSS
jgi:hypothetical protein